MSSPVVIVGGGECGVRTALALRRQGCKEAISLLAAEPLAPYERPPLSKDAISSLDEPTPRYVATTQQLAEAGIEFEADLSAQKIDLAGRTVALGDGRSLPFVKLLIATGARPRSLAQVGEGSSRVCTVRTFADAMRVRRMAATGSRVLVIGGGFIGLEVAASCRTRGCDVLVLEATPRLMGRVVPEELAARVAERHKQAGVSILHGVRVETFRESANAVDIGLSNGHGLRVDLVVVGVGVDPETRLAEDAGLMIDNGIAVDAQLQTEVEGVFAGGDCCSFPMPLYGGKRVRLESWRNAQLHAEIIAKNMLGEHEQLDAVPWFWSDQYDMTLQVAGLPGEGVETVTRKLSEDAQLWMHLDADGRIVAASGIGVGNAVARDIRLCEMLIARRREPSRSQLEAPDTPLKSLLAG